MSDFLDRISKLSPKRLALLALELHEQVEAAGQRASEPIAVVGMACRFPGGAVDPQAYWALLAQGRDAIRAVPADRWDAEAFYDADPDAPARMSVRNGGFLDNVDSFDASFFGISPREALTMDPQQRLLLEVSWEALEHAGLAPERLAGTPTGVFFGLCNNDHFHRVLQRGAGSIDAYLASGNAHSVASGRVAYFLGLQGPAISIDTACSSSLVALHIACRSLRSGESRTALAGGVNLMCSPETTIALSKAHMLAPDGRCKTFDAAADGFARGEGCGVVVLKRLSDAQADGDHVLAVIRGTAVNQDGRSGGLTVPNGPAQEAVVRAALVDAGVAPADIDYVEAHGTGTSLGDPIEVRALAAALGPDRSPQRPLLIGSVKTNFGHLESAAGVAGFIKVVLALQHERIPAHLHFHEPSPHIDWAAYPVSVTAQARAWPRGTRRRLAGLSSFGFSGTNAHMVLEEAPVAPTAERARGAERPVHCLALSARSDEALRDIARRYAEVLERGDVSIADVAYTAGVGRSHFAERLAVIGADAAEVQAALAACTRTETPAGLWRGSATPGTAPEVVFLYTGQGSQYPGMARALYTGSPVFRDVINRCDELLGADAQGLRLRAVLFDAEDAQSADVAASAPVHQTAWTQPALFAVEYALTQLWRSWGIEPSAVIGHSVGEYVAACVAGVFTLEEGLALIAERGRIMQALPAGGAMAALFAPIDDVERVLAADGGRVSVAAINAPDNVVVSGEAGAIDALLADFARRNVQGRRLFVSLAAHSPLVEPALDAMEACARTVTMRAPRIPVAWNLSGGAALSGGAPDARYWRRHLREPVRFSDGVAALHAQGFRTFLEVGPHPTLLALAQRCVPEHDTVWLTSLRRGKDDWRELMGSVAQLYVRGAAIDWAALDRPHVRRRLALPTYPFERRSFWIDPAAAGATALPPAPAVVKSLPGRRLPTAVPIFETLLQPSSFAGLHDHRVHGVVLVAGPVFLELAQAAARELGSSALRGVEAFVIHEPLVIGETGRTIQTHLSSEPDGALAFTIHSCAIEAGDAWRLHASGRLRPISTAQAAAGADTTSFTATRDALGAASSCEGYYARLAGLGIDLGPGFRSLRQAHRRDGEALAQVVLPDACASDVVVWAHPVLLDGALQAIGLAVPGGVDSEQAYLLTEIDRIDLVGALPVQLWCHARVLNARERDPAEWQAEVTLRSFEGGVLGVIRGARLRRASRDALKRAVFGAGAAELYYQVAWEAAPIAVPAAAALVAPDEFVPRVRARFGTLAAEHGLAVYEELLPALDRLSADHIIAALRELGFDDTPGRRIDVRADATALGVVARHARLYARLLQILAEDGMLRAVPGGYEVTARLPGAEIGARYEVLMQRHGMTDGELSMLRRCGPALARVLRGIQDPLELLFPGGSFDEARKLYVESPFAQTYNRALAQSLQAALARLPAGARLRVLELGAGTGGTTTYVLPQLPADRTEYTFTDLSPLFLERAAEQFAAWPFVRHALLDIERDPREQGFETGRYDIVIAANVLHATADLGRALDHVRALMAPGALLLLLEGVAPERWVDLSFGLTEGWWRFHDAVLRPDYPLISREDWLRELARHGFEMAASVPDAAWTMRGAAQQALIVARAAGTPRRWSVVSADQPLALALAHRLQDRGDSVTLRPIDADAKVLETGENIVYLGTRDSVSDGAEPANEPVLRWLQQAARGTGRIWLATQGVQPVDTPPQPQALAQAPLWGWGRGFALEHPACWGGLVDLPADADAAQAADALLASLDADDGEDQVAWRGGRRYLARLVKADTPGAAGLRLRADACYLVTGGYGGLGRVVARWLVEHGARHIALLGRRVDASAADVHALEGLGAHVHLLQGDVADAAAMAAQLAHLRAHAPPLRGVMHAAATLNAAPLSELSDADVSAMLRPKIAGTRVLDHLTRDDPLDFFVLFSSTTALLGASGLAHYAAANAYLDAFAQAAAVGAGGRLVLSVNWGTWEVMRLASDEDQRSYREGGLQPMAASEALDALDRLLTCGTAVQSVVAKVDWSVLKPLHEARRARPFLVRLGTVAQLAPPARVESGPSLKERLDSVPATMRRDLLLEFVQAEAAAVLGLGGAADVPIAIGLFDLGMDSLMAVELKRRLERGAGRALPSTLTFNYPNAGALAGFLETQLAAPAAAPTPAPAPVAAAVPTQIDAPASDAELDALSDAELEARLMARLEKVR